MKQVENNLRIRNLLVLPQIPMQAYGANLIAFRGSILWIALTDNVKACMNAFMKKVIDRKGESCNCKLCG